MKILFINTSDLKGGAARAIMRIMKGVQAEGIDARMLVMEKKSDDPVVIEPGSWLQRRVNTLRPYLDFILPFMQSGERVLFSPAIIPDTIIEQINNIDPDIVHLNWINGGFIRLESLAKINKPVIWTFHDMWAFTGGCHYSRDCMRYLEGCGMCPVLHSGREHDLSRKVFLRKEIIYHQIRELTITTLSKWLAGCITESPLFKERDVEIIPNGLDTTLFHPVNKAEARRRLNLSEDRKLVLFGAIRGVKSRVKGFGDLVKAISLINGPAVELVIVGSSSAGKEVPPGIITHCFGHVSDDSQLIDLFSAADVTAVPSLQEAFGQIATESMACGTPVVAYDGTGLADIIEHRKSGYLASLSDVTDLARGISWILEDENRRLKLSENCRRSAINKFDIRQVSRQFIDLYTRVLNTP